MRRVGIDVGGTNTDAVLIADGVVVRAVKMPTSADITAGIVAALHALNADGLVAAQRIDAVMIGTTHFINAVIQRRQLTRVAALRLGLPASASLPPFCDWPGDLAAHVRGGVWMVEGGHEYDGRPFMPLDRVSVANAARAMRAAGLNAVAISASFSPLDASHEQEAAAIVAAEHPGATITCSNELGRIGLLERENATLLNAALTDLARETITGFTQAIAETRIDAPLFITQNDGTAAEATQALRLPVYCFASGATNSMRGAAYLSGMQDAMVADVGGTTTDIGQLHRGFPREANSVMQVGGVRTLFRMPDLFSFGLGGGAFLIPDRLPGVSAVIHVPHGDCANAVGAAIAQVAGECDRIFRDISRAEAVAQAGDIAANRAALAGAERVSLKTIEVEDMPIAYLPGNSPRVRVVGDVIADFEGSPTFRVH